MKDSTRWITPALGDVEVPLGIVFTQSKWDTNWFNYYLNLNLFLSLLPEFRFLLGSLLIHSSSKNCVYLCWKIVLNFCIEKSKIENETCQASWQSIGQAVSPTKYHWCGRHQEWWWGGKNPWIGVQRGNPHPPGGRRKHSGPGMSPEAW